MRDRLNYNRCMREYMRTRCGCKPMSICSHHESNLSE